jgi:hypothetical protein
MVNVCKNAYLRSCQSGSGLTGTGEEGRITFRTSSAWDCKPASFSGLTTGILNELGGELGE